MPCAKPQLPSGIQTGHGARRGRKGRAFAEAQRQTHSEQRSEPADRAGQQRSQRTTMQPLTQSVSRGPNLSPIQPPMSWNSA